MRLGDLTAANYGGKALIVLGIAFVLAAASYYFYRDDVSEKEFASEVLRLQTKKGV